MIRFRTYGKKAQFYLFAIIVFCSFVFFSIAGRGAFSSQDPRLEKISGNFLTEVNYVIDSAAFQGVTPSLSVEEYVQDFTSYAQSKPVRFQVLYMLTENDTIHISNHMGDPVTIVDTGIIIASGSRETIQFRENLAIIHDNEKYSYSFKEDYELQFKALIKAEQ